MKFKIYSISDKYIAYLRNDGRLKNVFDNKETYRVHTRKYLGVVIERNGFNYFVPFSSPKNTDYITNDNGTKSIRPSIIPIIRMTTKDSKSGEIELKGTLKLSNMIPVPESELTFYSINDEADSNYKRLVEKEYAFIKSNQNLILKNASILYNQKIKMNVYYKDKKIPRYLFDTVDFLYAERKCLNFIEDSK